MRIECDEESLEDEFSEFLSIAVFTISKPEVRAELEGSAGLVSDQLVDTFLKASNGMERKHSLLALLMLVHMFIEDWREDEKLLKGPVQ